MNDVLNYDKKAFAEMQRWQKAMQREPTLFGRLSRKIQVKINGYIPEKIHKAVTSAIKQMMRAVLFTAGLASPRPARTTSLHATEEKIRASIDTYKKTAAVEGGITGAGGILLAFADFPVLMAIKVKMLFDIAGQYGFDTADYKERVYLLHIFQLAFSSDLHRKKIFYQMQHWNQQSVALPDDIHQFDWRNFQQEYRDYIDLAKMAQLIPVIGAPVGLIVNYRLLRKLGNTAINAYRMRLFESQPAITGAR
ncbi:MAG: EcsC family protein [Ferruginibacter sp.]|nr:EcsC family protein [Ferruginibacter sp.]